MAERMQVYKCERCGNIVEVLHGGPGQLVCCNADMELMEEKTADSSTEKHVPVIEKVEGGYKVTVGSVPHPMADAHFIEWIELVADGIVYRKYLNPGDVAEAIFAIDAESVSAREYCSVHGLWK
ncbi:MAG: desulfoferrodoxin [Candidatus Fermentibacteria bacterium]|nr:desulfoferrodoxin [Candidatus Fermentibacteria bacterium]